MFDSKFLDDLSMNSPAPGGGSVAALVGSLGAALSSMVAALTHEKKEMMDSKQLMDDIGEEAQQLKYDLAILVEEDTIAFKKIIKAQKLPGNTEQEKRIKEDALKEATVNAIKIPLETAKKCFRVLELSELLIKNGNPNSVSDAGVAAEVSLAGIRGGCMNALINLSGVNDTSFTLRIKNEVDDLISRGKSLHKNIFEKTLSFIDN